MKIGILTYHRTYNYGGCLQALATRIILESMGHEAFYVDYWPKYHKRSYSLVSFRTIWQAPTIASGIRSFLMSIRNIPYTVKRRKHFNHFLEECIIPYCKPLNEEYDVIVYGSDQIWRKQPFTNEYNPVYYADNDFKTKKNIAFSASMGNLPEAELDVKQILSLVRHFDLISVRENNLCEFLCKHGINGVTVTIDPTLLVPQKLWESIVRSKAYTGPKYILYYELNKETFDINKVRHFAKEKGLMLKILTASATHYDTENEITTAGPYEFIYWIKNADCVFSSSFHGLAFSLIYEKEVFVSFKTNSQRAKSLLESAGISNRFIKPGGDIPDNVEPINYYEVKEALSYYKKKSINYLTSISI